MILTLSCVTNDPSGVFDDVDVVFFICIFVLRVCVYVCDFSASRDVR